MKMAVILALMRVTILTLKGTLKLQEWLCSAGGALIAAGDRAKADLE